MTHQATFGRRQTAQRPTMRAPEKHDHALAEESAPPISPVLSEGAPAYVDPELEAWKQARSQRSRIPWAQLYLMASLCFGVASFVLPDSVNDNLDWLLYALMAASFYAGARRWWRQE